MSIYQYILLDVCGDESLTDFKPKFNAKHEKALFFIYLLYQLRKDTDFTPASWEARVSYWSRLTCSKRMNQVGPKSWKSDKNKVFL